MASRRKPVSAPDLSGHADAKGAGNGQLTPARFKRWRRFMALKQKDAAALLGLKKRVIQYYEKGDRDGKTVEIPKTVELACLALTLGHTGFDAEHLPNGAPLGFASEVEEADGED